MSNCVEMSEPADGWTENGWKTDVNYPRCVLAVAVLPPTSSSSSPFPLLHLLARLCCPALANCFPVIGNVAQDSVAP